MSETGWQCTFCEWKGHSLQQPNTLTRHICVLPGFYHSMPSIVRQSCSVAHKTNIMWSSTPQPKAQRPYPGGQGWQVMRTSPKGEGQNLQRCHRWAAETRSGSGRRCHRAAAGRPGARPSGSGWRRAPAAAAAPAAALTAPAVLRREHTLVKHCFASLSQERAGSMPVLHMDRRGLQVPLCHRSRGINHLRLLLTAAAPSAATQHSRSSRLYGLQAPPGLCYNSPPAGAPP